MTNKEAMAFIKTFMDEVNTQDCRGTESPFFYVIISRSADNQLREHSCFFTETDANRHLKENHYRYSSDAYVYLKHIWRAPEMDKFFEALNVIKGNKKGGEG